LEKDKLVRNSLQCRKAESRYLLTCKYFWGVSNAQTLMNTVKQNHADMTMCNGPTNALVCNKTLIQMSHIKTLKIAPKCFDHQMIIRELFDPG
jgi:hypothetical protein